MNSSPDMQAWQAALEEGDLDRIREQLALGVDPDALLPDKQLTPLMLSCSQGQDAITRVLLDAGASPDLARSQTGITPLMAAVHGKQPGIVELLCQYGAQVDLLDRDGFSALMQAVSSQDHAIVSILLAHKANPQLCGASAKLPIVQAAHDGDIEMVRMLLDAGATVDPAPGHQRDTALIEAADGGHLELVEMLLARGAAIDRQDANGNTPLALAAMMGHLPVVQALLNHGANPNCADKKGVTAFHRCWELGKPDSEAIALALLPNLRLEQANAAGQTPLFDSVSAGNHRLTQRLLDAGARLVHTDTKAKTVLHVAAKQGDVDLARLLVERGASHTAVDNKGRTPLHAAAEEGQVEMTRYLAGHCRMDAVNRFGHTPIMSAALQGESEAALVLLERKCALDVRSDEGGLQHCAASGGADVLLATLLSKMRVDETLNASGRSPLHEAAANNQQKAGALLVLAGANPTATTSNGLTIQDLGPPAFLRAVYEALAQRQASLLQDATTPATTLQARRRI